MSRYVNYSSKFALFLGGVSGKTKDEWNIFPEGYDSTLRSNFDGVHKATAVSDKEISHTELYGKGKMGKLIFHYIRYFPTYYHHMFENKHKEH